MDAQKPEPTSEMRDAAFAPVVIDDPAVMERLDSRVVVYWLMTGVFGFAVVAGVGFGVLWMFGDSFPGGGQVFWVGGAVAAGLLAVWTVIAPSLAYARWRFAISAELLSARYGIIFHEEKAIPISRLQHVDLTRGPIERMFGLATLVVFTAGTEGASFRLPGLSVERARELRDLILQARGEDVI